jgi:hypothetical protein
MYFCSSIIELSTFPQKLKLLSVTDRYIVT